MRGFKLQFDLKEDQEFLQEVKRAVLEVCKGVTREEVQNIIGDMNQKLQDRIKRYFEDDYIIAKKIKEEFPQILRGEIISFLDKELPTIRDMIKDYVGKYIERYFERLAKEEISNFIIKEVRTELNTILKLGLTDKKY